jgi:hypothetical protein
MNSYKILAGKPKTDKPLTRPRRRWENYIKMDIKEVRWEVWTGFKSLSVESSGNSCEHGNEP